MTPLVKAYKKYKESDSELGLFQKFIIAAAPSQVGKTIEAYEAEIARLKQAVISAYARGNLRYNIAMKYLQGGEISGYDWDYISDSDVELLNTIKASSPVLDEDGEIK